MKIEGRGGSKSILPVAALATLAAVAVVVGSALDRAGRPSDPELPLFEYTGAIGREDINSALEQLAPEIRGSAASFIAWELGNRYTILESAVRTESIMDQLLGRTQGRTKLVVVMEIETAGQAPWRVTEELPVQQIDGRWYLLKTPLSP